MRTISAGLAALILTLSAAGAAHALEVERQLVVDASVDAIWQKVGEPCSLKTWAPGIKDCTEKKLGADVVRTMTTPDGEQFVEQIVAIGHGYYAYRLLEGPLPISNYIAVMSLNPDATDPSKTLITWRSNFDAADTDKAAMVATIAGIYDGAMAAIAAYMKSNP